MFWQRENTPLENPPQIRAHTTSRQHHDDADVVHTKKLHKWIHFNREREREASDKSRAHLMCSTMLQIHALIIQCPCLRHHTAWK